MLIYADSSKEKFVQSSLYNTNVLWTKKSLLGKQEKTCQKQHKTKYFRVMKNQKFMTLFFISKQTRLTFFYIFSYMKQITKGEIEMLKEVFFYMVLFLVVLSLLILAFGRMFNEYKRYQLIEAQQELVLEQLQIIKEK